jgi:hypothetical protein
MLLKITYKVGELERGIRSADKMQMIAHEYPRV